MARSLVFEWGCHMELQHMPLKKILLLEHEKILGFKLNFTGGV